MIHSIHQRVLVTGYAQAPRGACEADQSGSIGVALEIDPATDMITDAEFMTVSDLVGRFCRDLVVGYSLSQGIDPLLHKLSKVLLVPSQQAFLMALRSAAQRYWERTKRRAAPPGA